MAVISHRLRFLAVWIDHVCTARPQGAVWPFVGGWATGSSHAISTPPVVQHPTHPTQNQPCPRYNLLTRYICISNYEDDDEVLKCLFPMQGVGACRIQSLLCEAASS